MEINSSFFSSLFDLSFTNFITIKLVKIMYIISIFISAVIALMITVAAFNEGFLAGLLTLLILAPIIFFINVIFSRLWLELVIVIFRISENTGKLADNLPVSTTIESD